MSLGSAMVVSIALLTQSLAELPYLKSVQILNACSCLLQMYGAIQNSECVLMLSDICLHIYLNMVPSENMQ